MKGNESSSNHESSGDMYSLPEKVLQNAPSSNHTNGEVEVKEFVYSKLILTNYQPWLAILIFMGWLFLEIVVFRDTMHGTIIWFDGSLQSLLVFLEVKPTTRRLRSQPTTKSTKDGKFLNIFLGFPAKG